MGGEALQPSDRTTLDAALRLLMVGGKPTAGAVDACLGPDPGSSRLDRLAADLAVSGNAVKASGTSLVDGKPWSLTGQVRVAGDKASFTGRLDYGGRSLALSREGMPLETDDYAFTQPPRQEAEPGSDFASPNLVEVDVPLGKTGDVARALRERGAALATQSVVPTCPDLRSGRHSLTAVVAPERAAALVEALNAVPGLKARMAQEIGLPNGFRFPAEALAGGLGGPGEAEVARKALDAAMETLAGSTVAQPLARDPATGRWTAVLERETATTRPLGLVERDTFTLTVGMPPYAKGKPVLVLGRIGTRLVDPSGRLRLDPMHLAQEESLDDSGLAPESATADIRARLGKALGGEGFDEEANAWKPIR